MNSTVTCQFFCRKLTGTSNIKCYMFIFKLDKISLTHFTCLSFVPCIIYCNMNALFILLTIISIFLRLYTYDDELIKSVNVYIWNYLTHKVHTLNSPSNKNVLPKSHTLWSAVKLLLWSEFVVSTISETGVCVWVCVRVCETDQLY